MVGGQVNPVICVIIDNMCYYKVRQVLQSATIITKCDSTAGGILQILQSDWFRDWAVFCIG